MVVWCVCASLASIGAIGWLIAVKTDLRQMRRQVAVLAPTGTQAHITTTTFDAEVTRLIREVNLMLDRHRASLGAAAASEAALKSALTNLSHDLRTPLTAAIGYLQMAQATGYGVGTGEPGAPDDRPGHLEIAVARLVALGEWLDQVFSLTKLAEGATVLSAARVNLTEQVQAALAEAYPRLERGGFTTTVRLPDAPVFCRGDERAIARVLANLLSNVVSHGTGEVSVAVEGTTVEIANQVADPAAVDPEAMFTRFYTGDQSRTNRHTGLGLAIASELARAMGGRLGAAVEGDRLVARLTLPAA